ncbi:MAG: diadenylate cyclase CdaA [Lachnospiraceae bacterium]|nr:diadenylate cyclase CdaA [Lachnospiraceae bacterium]MBP5184162.1 diadenylate cyclase CdaA [Lachnospiraceae bacterium]
MWDKIQQFSQNFLNRVAWPKMRITDFLEILILAFLIYKIIKWIKKTRAWIIVKGLAVLLVVWIGAYLLNFNVILWIFANTITVGITAIIILFQPEFRQVLENLGQKYAVNRLSFLKENEKENFTDKTLDEIIRATFDLARNKTGALIVIEQDVLLNEYIKTGIDIDAVVSSQLLINIFEHNTPLHDGAVIIRNDRITSATCYLPLSNNLRLPKELGTRHRAGIGLSECTDAFVIIVSEETGRVSIAQNGELTRNAGSEQLRNKLVAAQKKVVEPAGLVKFISKFKKEKTV